MTLRALGNSFGVGAITTVLALTLGLFGAYGLARYPVPGKGMLLLFIVGGTAFPQIATVSPLYLLMRALDLRDTWLALILANTSFALPLVIWLLMGFLQEIPAQLEEAAAVDGASRPRAFRWIVLLSSPPASPPPRSSPFSSPGTSSSSPTLSLPPKRAAPCRSPSLSSRRVRGAVGRHRGRVHAGERAAARLGDRAAALSRPRTALRRPAGVARRL